MLWLNKKHVVFLILVMSSEFYPYTHLQQLYVYLIHKNWTIKRKYMIMNFYE